VGNIPPILFGLGAIGVARNPDGVLAMQARQARALVAMVGGRRKTAGSPGGSPHQKPPVAETAALTGSGAV
jgi:branched-chain amino acid transport system permease protein